MLKSGYLHKDKINSLRDIAPTVSRSSRSDIQIRRFREQDISAIFQIQSSLFPQSLIIQDKDIFKNYYLQLNSLAGCGCFVAIQHDRVVGYLSYCSNRQQFLSKFFNENKYLLVKYIALNLTSMLKLKSDIFAKINRLNNLVKILNYEELSTASIERQILTIGVLKDYRRQGIGSKMLDYCYVDAIDSNVSCLRLSVSNSNEPAIALYRRDGWNWDSSNNSTFSLVNLRQSWNFSHIVSRQA